MQIQVPTLVLRLKLRCSFRFGFWVFGLLVSQLMAIVAQTTPRPEILGAPERLALGGWRVRWKSETGRVYRLQRWTTDELGLAGEPIWTDLATVAASQPMSQADDPTAASAQRRYYRVVLVVNPPADVSAPIVSAIETKFAPVNNHSGATLRVQATDNLGVTRLTFLNGSVVLGEGTRGSGAGANEWSFNLPLDPKVLGARFLIARAVDAAGNVGYSPVFPLGLVDSDHFVPLDANGAPVEGGIVQAVAPGQWGPVEYRPGGRNLLGQGPGFFIRFPNGVRLVNEEGAQFLEFTDAIAGFGPAYPMQLKRLLTKTGGSTQRLPVGPVNLPDVLSAFGIAPEAGVEISVFGRFPLIWRKGVIDDGGIRGATFSFLSTGLPLPGTSGEYPDLVIDFTRTEGLRIPFQGEFVLPDGTASPVTLRAGGANPLWLTLHPNGRVSLVGPAELLLPDGGYVRTYVNLDEPNYRMTFGADGLHVQALGRFVDLLPPNAGVCLPAQNTAAQLDAATRCLNSFANAFLNFNGTVAAISSSQGSAGVPPASASVPLALPPDPFNSAASVLEAWAFSALANTTQRLPLDLIRDVVRQMGQSASAAHDLDAALRHQLALMRALQAIQSGAATGDAAAQADLQAALAQAESAALARAQEPDALLSLETMTASAKLLVETEALRQTLGRPASTLITTALPQLLQRFATRYTEELGVVPGVLLPGQNAIINGMNRFEAAQHIRDLIDLIANVQLLGINLTSTAIDEALGQLAIRLANVALADASAAEQADDYPAFLFALKDVLDIIAAEQLGVFPTNPTVTALLPGAGDVPALAQRLDAIMTRDLSKPIGERTFNNTAAEIRALLRILRQMPAGVSFASAAFRRAYDTLETVLASATEAAALAAENDLANVVLLIEAGTLHRELGRRFQFPVTESWETVRLPRAVARLDQLALQSRAWSELNSNIRLLINAADRTGLAGDQTNRRAYLDQVVAMLATSREVARAQIQNTPGALQAADMLLPGDIFVENVAGTASYNHLSGAFSGRFRGALFLPKFRAALVVNNAAISSGGVLDLNVFGTAGFPGGQMTVPERGPLRLSVRPGDFRLRGHGRIDLESGVSFESFVTWDDPNYAFGIAEQGLKLDLGRKLALQIPTLNLAQVGAFAETNKILFAEYFHGLNASLERLIGSVTNFPTIDPTVIGQPPEFEPQPIIFELEDLNAFSDTVLVPLQRSLRSFLNDTLGGVVDRAREINRQATEARGALLTEQELLNNQIKRLQVRRKVRQAVARMGPLSENDPNVIAKSQQVAALLTDGLREEVLLTYKLITPEVLASLPESYRLAKALFFYKAELEESGSDFSDLDLDGNPNSSDNAPAVANTNQSDRDNDGLGDAGDPAPDNPSAPSAEFRTLLKQGSNLEVAAGLLIRIAATNRLVAIGLNPQSGAVQDAQKLAGLTEDDLEFTAKLLLAIAGNADLVSDDIGSILLSAARTVNHRLGEVLSTRLSNTSPADYVLLATLRDDFLRAAVRADPLGDAAFPALPNAGTGSPFDFLNDLQPDQRLEIYRTIRDRAKDRERRHAEELARDISAGSKPNDIAAIDDESPGFIFDLGEFVRVLGLPEPAAFKATVSDDIRFRMEELKARTISPEFLRLRVKDTLGVVEEIVDLSGWITRNMSTDTSTLTNLQFTLTNVTVQITQIAEARKEWWVAEEYFDLFAKASRIYGDNLHATIQQAFVNAKASTLLTGQRIASSFGQLLNAVQLQNVVLRLPGEISMPYAFGSIFYNRLTDELSGQFGGRVELPAMGGTLEVLNASISNKGEFDLNAFGSVSVPVGTISIPSRHPLHIRQDLGQPLHFAGGLRLDLTNGMHFEGFIGLEDPVYTFGLSAGGLRFDLVDKLVVLKPTLGGTGAFTQQVASALNDYFQSMNASFEALAGLADPLQIDPAGQSPNFEAPTISFEFSAIEAFANSVNTAFAQGRQQTHEAVYGALKGALQNIADNARSLELSLSNTVASLDSRAADLERFKTYNATLKGLAKTLNKMAGDQREGNPTPVTTSQELAAALNVGRTNTLALLASPNSKRDLKTIKDVATLALDFSATEQLLGTQRAEVLNAVPVFLAGARSNVFRTIGLNPATGGIENAAIFEAIPLELLDNHAKDLFSYAAALELAGGTNELGVIRAAAGTLANRQRTLIVEQLCDNPDMPYIQRMQLTSTLAGLINAAGAGAFDWPSQVLQLNTCALGPFNLQTDGAEIRKHVSRAIREREAEQRAFADARASGWNDIYQTFSRMNLKFNFNFDADVLGPIQRDLRTQLGRLDEIALETWPRDRLRDGAALLGEVVNLAETLENFAMPPEVVRIQTITIPSFTVQLTTVAEAQKAWWELSDASRRLLEASQRKIGASGTILSNAFVSAASTSIRSADRILQAFAALRPQLVKQDFFLPGDDLVVREVFGSLLYNRQTSFLSGTFGGRLELPSIGTNVFFSINQATIANDGSFALSASTRTPLPFGRVQLTANVTSDLTPANGVRFLGDGQLLVPSNTSTQAFNATLFYNQAADVLSVNTLATNLNVRFSDDFVLFDAGFGFTVARNNTQGRITALGSAGLFATTHPLPASITRTNFQLVADQITTSFSYVPGGFGLSLDNGTLRLPSLFATSICPTNPPGVISGPAIALTPINPIAVNFTENPDKVAFSGALDFHNIGFSVPGISNLALEVCSAKLVLPTNQLPRLTNLNASIQIPIPGQTTRVDVVQAAFSLDGFPTGTIALRDNLTLFSQGGFEFILLGTATTNCNLPTALSIARLNNGTPFFRLDGGIEFAVPPSVLGSTNGGRLFARSCGFFQSAAGLRPQVQMENFAIGGTMRLGGSGGLLIDNGLLAFDGLTNVYAPTPDHPFSVTLSGALNIPNGPRLSLQNARFNFVGETLPRFTLSGLGIAQNPDYEAAPGLILNVTAADIVFLDPNRPFPQVLLPDNIEVGMSAQVNIPPGANPIISGRVDDLRAQVQEGVLKTRLAGFGMSINNLEFPPLSLSGDVYIGGLDTVNAASAGSLSALALPGREPGLFFAGRVGGLLNDVGVKALLAFDLKGPIGVCLDVNAGPAGIPLGPTGFLLTGAAGGVSFLNSNSDPCDFTTFYPVGPDGHPVETAPAAGTLSAQAARNRPGAAMTWAEYDQYLQRAKLAQASAAQIEQALQVQTNLRRQSVAEKADLQAFSSEAPQFPCPTGDCPPPTVNILCQPHPDTGMFPNKVIVKFSSLDEQAVNAFGVTRQFVEGLGLTDARSIGINVAASLRQGIDGLVPRADPALLGAQQALQINTGITNFFNEFESFLAELIRQGVSGALGNAGSVYDKILEVAYAGVPCPDATVKLTGNFSHAAVSTALSATAGVVVSTAGSAGVVGSINVLGVPFGKMKSFVSATDNRGDPNPSFCGDTLVAVGPIELGQLKAKFECPDCVTGMLNAFGQFTSCMADDAIRSVLMRVAPEQLSKPTAQALNDLRPAQKLMFIAEVFQRPAIPGFADCFRNSAIGAIQSFNPSYVLCGDVTPKLFGIPLSASVVQVNAAATRTNIAASFAFSPSYIINNLMLCAGTVGLVCQPIFPALDSASMGFGFGLPDFSQAIIGALQGKFSSPQAIADFTRQSFDSMLANATFTIGYEINPFGFKLADAEARVLMPNLTEHPARPGAAYVAPENRGQNFPSRLTVALTALEKGFLANPLWKGTAQDLPLIFQGSPEQSTLQNAGLSFQKDYFPYGGLLGAARLALPRVIVDAPPTNISTILDPQADVFARLGAAADVIGNYVLQTSDVGTLAFYIPAPNPPFFTDNQGRALTPQKLLEAIQTFDPSQIGLPNLYPLDQFFFAGYMDGRLLGIPIARADVVAVPASGNSSAFFRVRSGIPSGSWLKSFVDNASLTFEIRQSPPVPIEQLFAGIKTNIDTAVQGQANAATALNLVNQVGASLVDGLPKVSLDLAVNNFRIPDPLTNLLTMANTSARLVAYSPRFNPNFSGNGPVAEVTRRGGIALQGSMNFANLISIPDAQLGIFPSDNLALPGLAGHFVVAQLGIPGAALKNATFDFNSAPAVNQPFLAASGTLDPIALQNPFNTNQVILTIQPLSGKPALNASFSMLKPAGGAPQGRFSIDPAAVNMPVLGPSLSAKIHGATTNDPFTFSTTAPWNATATLEGQLVIRDLSNQEIVSIGSSGGKFTASVSGNGRRFTSLVLSNIPTGLDVTVFPGRSNAQRFTVGGATPAQLVINGDGTFNFTLALGGDLAVPGIPTPTISGGASVTVTQSLLRITGNLAGGLVAPGASANGTFTIDGTGRITLTGNATIPPQTFGAIQISGLTVPELSVQLFEDGYALANGSRVKVLGVTDEFMTISPFTNRANRDFSARVTAGDFSVPNFFRVSSGDIKFQRLSGVSSIEISSPTLTLMPGTPNAKALDRPFTKLFVASDGSFYGDSGTKDIDLLGGLKITGRVEVGNRPGIGQPKLSMSASSLAFGTVNFGTTVTKEITFSNTGEVPLLVSLASTAGAFIPSQSDLSLPVGQFKTVSVQFRPSAGGSFAGALQVVMNPGGTQPSISLSGTAVDVPLFDVNSTSLSFGEVSLGGSATRRLVVRNTGTAPLTLSDAKISSAFSVSPAVKGQTLNPGESQQFDLTFQATALESFSGTLVIAANDPAKEHSIDLTTGNVYIEKMVRVHEGGPTLRSIAMATESVGWAVGDEGTVLRTANGGRSWQTIRLPISGEFRTVSVRDQVVFMGGLQGLAVVSTDGGNTWRKITAASVGARTNNWLASIFVPNASLTFDAQNLSSTAALFLAGSTEEGGGIMLREESGAFATALNAPAGLNSIAFYRAPNALSGGQMMVVGDNAFAARSTDAGATWVNVNPGGLVNFRGVALVGILSTDTSPDAWIVGDSGVLLTASSVTSSFIRRFGPTTENFTAVLPGYIVGENGSAYVRPTFGTTASFVRENPSGAYSFTAVAANSGGTWLAGEFGQIYFRPSPAPNGPFITFAPGQAEFGVQAVGGTKTMEIQVMNRGFAPLNVTGIKLAGSSAFSVNTTSLAKIGTNETRTFLLSYAPKAQGDSVATVQFTHDESTVVYELPVHGRAQVNTWNYIATPNGENLRDIQFIDDKTAFAITSNDVLRSADGGLTWSKLKVTPPGVLNRLHFVNSSLGFAFGGTVSRFTTCTGTCQSFILRTANGGDTWTTIDTGVSTPVEDLHMVSTLTGFAVTSSKTPLIGVTTAGDVLRTTDGGQSWKPLLRPAPRSGAFDGRCLHATSTSVIFVGTGNGELFRSANGGGSWGSVLNVATVIEDIQFLDANNGWIVGQDGLFRRTTTGGTVSTSWPGVKAFTSANLRRVQLLNLNTGWVVGDDAQAGYIFRTDNGGSTWFDELDLSTASSPAPQNVSGRSATVAFAVAGQGVYRGTPFQAVASASPALASLTDYGVISFGSAREESIEIRNVGSASLQVASVTVENDEDDDAFTLTSPGAFTVFPGKTGKISVRYAPPSIARHHATVTFLDVSGQVLASTDLVGEAEVFPTSLIFETQPLGLALTIDSRSITGRLGITVVGESKVPNDVINPFEWRFGTSHTISAAPSQVRDGYEYQFQGWEPSQEATFTLLATNVPMTYRAVYVPIRLMQTNASGPIPGFAALGRQSLHALSAGPSDVPGGPYIRVSQASLQVPGMGNLSIQGSAFLSADRFEFTMENDPLGDPKLLAIDAGSWRLSYTNNVRFVLRAQNPGIQLLSKAVTGSSQVLFDITSTRLVTTLNTTGNTPVVPSVVELGPSQIFFTNTLSGSTRFSSLRASGSLRLLRKPDNSFAISRSFNFFASDGPFTNTIDTLPNPIISTPLAVVGAKPNASIEIRRDVTGTYGVAVRNIDLSLLGGSPTTISSAEVTQSKLSLSLGKMISFGQLVYNAANNTTLEWRFQNSGLAATISSGDLTVPLVNHTLHFNGFTLDSTANFDLKVPLPTLSFDGIDVDGGGPLSHNYIRLMRTSGVTKFQFQDRRSFFDNTFKLKIDISSAGTASGTFSGNLVVEDFFGCDEIGVGDISLSYNSASNDYQFRGNVRLETCVFGTHDFRVKFGSSGAKFCHLFCDDNGCSEDLCTP